MKPSELIQLPGWNEKQYTVLMQGEPRNPSTLDPWDDAWLPQRQMLRLVDDLVRRGYLIGHELANGELATVDFKALKRDTPTDSPQRDIETNVSPNVSPDHGVITMEAALTTHELTADWLVPGLLRRKGVGVLFGQPQEGKTLLTENLAAVGAQGGAWLGIDLPRFKTLYVHLEDQEVSDASRRLMATFRLNREEQNRLHWAPASRLPEQIDAVAGLEYLTEEAKDREVDLVVIDPLAYALADEDENSNTTMRKVVANARRLAEGTGAAVLFVHHEGKGNTGARGGSALTCNADTALRVHKGKLSVVKAKPGKCGYVAAQFEIGEMTAAGRDFPVIQQADRKAEKQTRLGKWEKVMLDLLGDSKPDTEIRRAFYSAYGDSGPAGRKAFSRAERGLRDKGKIETRDGWWTKA